MTRRARMGPIQAVDRGLARMAPGGRRSASESPVLPFVRQVRVAAPVVVVPPPTGRWWPMDDAGPNLTEAGGGAPFVPVRLYGSAVPTYQVSPLAPGSTHAVTFPGGIMLQAAGFDAPNVDDGWVTWDFWTSVTPDEGFATTAQLAADPPDAASTLTASFTPTSIICSLGYVLVGLTFPRPPNPVHLRWSVRTSGGTAVETVIEINGGVAGHYTLGANDWHWGGAPNCGYYSGAPMTLDEVRIYAGLEA